VIISSFNKLQVRHRYLSEIKHIIEFWEAAKLLLEQDYRMPIPVAMFAGENSYRVFAII